MVTICILNYRCFIEVYELYPAIEMTGISPYLLVTTPLTEVTGIYRQSEEIVIPISKC
jgi:hypothetical protein